MAMVCCFNKTVFLLVLFFCLTGFNSASAEKNLDLAKYYAMINEDGSAINDEWWIISNIFGRDNEQTNGQQNIELWHDVRQVVIIREIDSENNTVAIIEGSFEADGELTLIGAHLWEIQDSHIVLHAKYLTQNEMLLRIKPAPRFPRFFNPGEGFSWNSDLYFPDYNLQLKENQSFSYHGKTMTLPSNAVPGDNSLEGVALVTLNETTKIYVNNENTQYSNITGQAGFAPGKGMVWSIGYMNGRQQLESELIDLVRTFSIDEVVDWGRGDYPDILQNQDIEMIVDALSAIPLATSFDDVSKTGTGTGLNLHQKADIIFNWIESQLPDLFSPVPQPTVVDEGLIWRSYNYTDTALGIIQNSLYYLDGSGELHDLGDVDAWLNQAMPQE
ncbi:hypothetical protein [Desulfonatronovibrio magnus]|uniref:hypothetical protein n=1 Tax=Desulfonatronovibrio magnus TaxID=698827 RepID=UPI0005EBA1EB|nr:hypothetical protein [Desulfonatronovibrio magnus]